MGAAGRLFAIDEFVETGFPLVNFFKNSCQSFVANNGNFSILFQNIRMHNFLSRIDEPFFRIRWLSFFGQE